MKSSRNTPNKNRLKRLHPDSAETTQALVEKKDGGHSLESLSKNILEKMALSLDVESLYSYASATLVSKKLNPALNSVLRTNSFWQKYAEKNPLSSIDNSNTKKQWLQSQYIKTQNINTLDYEYLWASVVERLKQGSYLLPIIANEDEVQKNLYDYIKTQYAIDSNHAAEKSLWNTILFWAILLNRIEEVKRYLKAQVCVNIDNAGIRHPLNTPGSINTTKKLFHSAVVSGHEQIVEILCSLGVYQPHEASDQKLAAIAVKYNRAKVLAVLLAHGASSNFIINGAALLYHAALKGFIDCVKVLVENHASINHQMDDGSTALQAAAYYGHTDIAKYLLKHGANPNLYKKKSKLNALHRAIISNQNELAKCLILYTDNLEAVTSIGGTALHYAASAGLTEIVELLLKLNANKKIPDNDGNTPLSIALQKENIHIINLLKPENNMINDELRGHTLLTFAAADNRSSLIDELIKRNESVDTPNQYGTSPLITATLHGHAEATLGLLKHKANVNFARKIDGLTPLAAAATKGNVEIAKILLQAGADPNQPNHKGTTPLWIAAWKDNVSMMELLINARAKVDTKATIFKKWLLADAKDKPPTVTDKIEDYFKTIGSDQAEMSAIMIANLMENKEAETLLLSKRLLAPEHEPTKYRRKGLGG